jgi:hypothetical protein
MASRHAVVPGLNGSEQHKRMAATGSLRHGDEEIDSACAMVCAKCVSCSPSRAVLSINRKAASGTQTSRNSRGTVCASFLFIFCVRGGQASGGKATESALRRYFFPELAASISPHTEHHRRISFPFIFHPIPTCSIM